MDWESDPELKKMYEEFLASLDERKASLENLRSDLSKETSEMISVGSTSVQELILITHRLAGVAATYGFGDLTEVCGLIDDFLQNHENLSLVKVKELTGMALLAVQAAISKQDLDALKASDLYRELEDFVKSLDA